ncbi:MAG: hypothetical protein ABIN58_01865 [candidate division WOR-3 bacterium]
MTTLKTRLSSATPEGRPKGTFNPKSLEQISKKKEHIFAALLRSALAGDAAASRVCLELIGELPRSKSSAEGEAA